MKLWKNFFNHFFLDIFRYHFSPDWIKNKKATINPIKKKDNKCFQYALTVALNHVKIGGHPQRITKIKPFINKYN